MICAATTPALPAPTVVRPPGAPRQGAAGAGKIGWAEQLDLAHALRLCGRTTEAAAMHLASTLNVKHEALTVSGGGGWTCTSLASPGPSGWVGLALAGVLAALLRRRMG